MKLENFREIINQLPRRGNWKVRSFAQIIDITIHHSAAPVQLPRNIATWHTVGKQYPGIAYHYLVYPDGNIYQVNEDTSITWHNGFCNTQSIGICMIGNFMHQPPTPHQIQATAALVEALKAMHPSIKHCTGHKEYKGGTLCPGIFFNMAAFRQKVGLSSHPRAQKVVNE